ncbi:MAG: cytochrome c oxidase subunit I [Sandaracinaceae bacterium]|nr:cytochrome c oxidase subunit I [Sandaracinaceae bacterium]
MTTQTTTHAAGSTAHGHGEVDYIRENTSPLSWIVTLDHKRLGILYLVSTLTMFMVGGVYALLIRTELLTPGRTIMDPDTYNKVFTLHGAIMVFLFIIPSVPAALGNFFLPIMLGAKDVAFPRLNLMSFYVYVLGAIFALVSIFTNSIDTGWTFYTPYSQTTSTATISMTLAVFILGFSSILTGVNFMATVHKLRAPGLHWKRLPLFVWGIYATAVIQVLATPVLAITLLMLLMEKVLSIGWFDPRLGGDPVLFQHFFWFYSHPAVYIMILPGMAVVNEIIATFSRRKIFGYMFVAMSSVALALLGFLVWGHHMFVAGMSEYATMVFSALTFFVAIPSGVKVFNWVATLYNGSVSFQSPMLYALAFIVLFTIGGLTGLFLGTLSVDVHLHDTYFVVAHFHYVMVGGTVIGFIGGLHYWWPKMTGKMYSEKIARIAFVFIFIGFNMTFLTQFVLGSQGMPRRYYDYLDHFQPLHGFSSVGAYVLGVGFSIMLGMFIYSLFKGEKAPPNPWGSAGFEWATSSPPIMHNFHGTPVIHRGPYDYHLATEAELFDGFPEDLPATAKPAAAKPAAKQAPEPEPAKAAAPAPASREEEE